MNYYYLIIEEKFYLTPEVRKEILYFDNKEALKEYKRNFQKDCLHRILETGFACISNGQLCPGKRARI